MNSTYKRMLEGMQRKEKECTGTVPRGTGSSVAGARPVPARTVPKPCKPWFLYILRCSDGTFYTGITNNLERRFKRHNDGTGARYTRTRRPVELIYHEMCAGRTKALVRECAVKSMPRLKKEELIAVNFQ